jgi:CHASE3 domain sensor protein
LENIISFTKDAETGQRGYLLTGDPLFLEPYEGAQTRVMNALDKVKSLTLDDTAQQQSVEQLRRRLRRGF